MKPTEILRNWPGAKEIIHAQETKKGLGDTITPEVSQMLEKQKWRGIKLIAGQILTAIMLVYSTYELSRDKEALEVDQLSELTPAQEKPPIWKTHPEFEKIGKEEAEKKLFSDMLKIVREKVADAFDENAKLDNLEPEHFLTENGDIVDSHTYSEKYSNRQDNAFVLIKPTKSHKEFVVHGISEKDKNFQYKVKVKIKTQNLQVSFGNNGSYTKMFPFKESLGISSSFIKTFKLTEYTIAVPFTFTIETMDEEFESKMGVVKPFDERLR